MGSVLSQSVFVLSLDLPACGDARASTTADGLVKLLQRSSIQSTWCSPEPARCPTAVRVVEELSQHEVALIGDESWVGPTAGRTRFARELARRCREASSAGTAIRAMALDGVDLKEHLDLLVKHRIAVLRPHVNEGELQPQSWRYGIWRAPAGFHLPERRILPFGGVESAVHRALRRAAEHAEIVHVSVNLSQLNDLRPLERILTDVQRRQLEGSIRVATLSRLADELAPQRVTPVSRSVLRSVLRVA